MFAGMPAGNHVLPVTAADFNLASISDNAIRRGYMRIQVMRFENMFCDLFYLADSASSFSEIAGKFCALAVPARAEKMSMAPLILGSRKI